MRHLSTKRMSGQGVVEYVLVTALVTLSTIAIFRAFRADLTEAYKKAGRALVQSMDETVSPNQGGGGE